MKLVIAISTSVTFEARREICRESWMAQLPHPDVARVFFGMGTFGTGRVFEEQGREDDVEFLDCPDDYRALCLKTQAMLRVAAVQYEADWVFKCDDDTFVHVGRLVERAKEAEADFQEYVGRVQGGPPFAEGGAGYLLSRRAAELVADADAPAVGMEDAWVGRVLAGFGVTAVNDTRFAQRGGLHPTPRNKQITAHLIRSHTLARNLQKAFETPSVEKEIPVVV